MINTYSRRKRVKRITVSHRIIADFFVVRLRIRDMLKIIFLYIKNQGAFAVQNSKKKITLCHKLNISRPEMFIQLIPFPVSYK